MKSFCALSPLPDKPAVLWVSETVQLVPKGLYLTKWHCPLSADSILHTLSRAGLGGHKPEVLYAEVCGWEVASL